MDDIKKLSSNPFFIICLLAIALRVLWVCIIPVIPISDSINYDLFARNIWLHGIYGWNSSEPTSFYPVGLSAVYSFFYYLFGHNYWPISIFNIACSLVIIIFLKLLCDRFFEHKQIGLIAAAIISFWPTLIFFCSVLATELPYMACLLAGFYFFTSRQNSFLFSALIAGVLFSTAYYIRPLAIVPLGIGICCLLAIHASRKIVILRSLISIFILVLAVAPWAKRNYELYNGFVPMSTNGGVTFWMGNTPGSNGGYKKLPKFVESMDEYTRNNVLKGEAFEYIKEEPLKFVTRTIWKFWKFHSSETIGVHWNEEGIKNTFGDWAIVPLKLLSHGYWVLILLLSLVGIGLFVKEKGFWKVVFHPYILLWMSTAGIHSLVVSQDRYHLPIVPMVAAFAALSISLYLSNAKKSNQENIS